LNRLKNILTQENTMGWKVNFTQGDNDPPNVGWVDAVFNFGDDGATPDFSYRDQSTGGRIDIATEKDVFIAKAQRALDAKLELEKVSEPHAIETQVKLTAEAAKSSVLTAKLAEIAAKKAGE
jgi:hypothetical protein